MDDQPDNEEAGLPLGEAFQRHCDPEIIWAWREAAAEGNFRGAVRHGGPAWKLRRKFKEAQWAFRVDGIERLISGELVALGYLMSPRDPTAPRVPIPTDVFQDPKLELDFKGSTVAGNGLEFVSVRVYPASEVPGAEKALAGLTLVEAFRRFVLADATLQELAETAHRDCPGWAPLLILSNGSYRLGGPVWPVNFENWSSPSGQANYHKHPIRSTGGPENPPPPDAVVAVYERVHGRVRRLITWFRTRALAVEGTVEPVSPELPRLVVDVGWWSRSSAEVDFGEGLLLDIRDGGRKTSPVFSDMKVLLPENVAAGSGDAAALEVVEEAATLEPGEGTPTQKKKRGRKPGDGEIDDTEFVEKSIRMLESEEAKTINEASTKCVDGEGDPPNYKPQGASRNSIIRRLNRKTKAEIEKNHPELDSK